MSDKVSIDSLDDLIRFRDHLRSFNNKLGDDFGSIRSHWGDLGESWQDDRYTQFGQALGEITQGIERYLHSSDEYEQYLLTLIERLRVVLETRL